MVKKKKGRSILQENSDCGAVVIAQLQCMFTRFCKAHILALKLYVMFCIAKFPGKHHLQSILTSQSGVTLFFISRQSCECGRRLARAQLWAVLPVVGGEFEVLGKRAVHSQ